MSEHAPEIESYLGTTLTASPTSPLKHRYCALADTLDSRAELEVIRRNIHQQPELAFDEVRTSGLVASLLETWGYTVTRGVGGTGVVGTLRCGDSGHSVGIRADMDALPIHERTALPYASVNAGRMHACGHDGHTAILLGAAKHLARTRNFDGTVHLIFQPAEEIARAAAPSACWPTGCSSAFPAMRSSGCTTIRGWSRAISCSARAPSWRRATRSPSPSAARAATPRARTSRSTRSWWQAAW